MQTATFRTYSAAAPSRNSNSSNLALWAGRLLTGVPLFLLALDGLMKFSNLPQVIEASAKVGFRASTLPLLGAVELVSVLCISIRRFAPFGAVLVSAYLGGAVATHVSHGDPLFSHVLVPIYVAALIWGGLYLRDERIRALSPFKR